MKSTKKKVPYASISVTIEDRKRFKEIHKRNRSLYSSNGFFRELLDVYEKSLCPECRNLLKHKPCSCKESERI